MKTSTCHRSVGALVAGTTLVTALLAGCQLGPPPQQDTRRDRRRGGRGAQHRPARQGAGARDAGAAAAGGRDGDHHARAARTALRPRGDPGHAGAGVPCDRLGLALQHRAAAFAHRQRQRQPERSDGARGARGAARAVRLRVPRRWHAHLRAACDAADARDADRLSVGAAQRPHRHARGVGLGVERRHRRPTPARRPAPPPPKARRWPRCTTPISGKRWMPR